MGGCTYGTVIILSSLYCLITHATALILVTTIRLNVQEGFLSNCLSSGSAWSSSSGSD